MKKILYILILVLLMFSVLSGYVNAGFFDDLLNLITNRIPTPSTTTQKQTIITTEDNKSNSTNNVLCFNQELELGDDNLDVRNLQSFLFQSGFYKEGLITGYFGKLTKAAVINFQNYYFDEILKPLSLLKATGYVGQATLHKINNLIKCNITTNQNNIDSNINKVPTIDFNDTTTTIIINNNDYIDDITENTVSIKRYSCSNGQCVQNPTGAFLTSNCNNMCVASSKRYACNSSGICQLNTYGLYTTDNCNNECIPVDKKWLEEIYYYTTKVANRCWCTEEKIGDFFKETLLEDKLFYPQLKITEPISYKNHLTLNTLNFPSKPIKGCCDFGWIKICLDGTTPQRFGYELIDNFTKLSKYFAINDTAAFSSDFFDKNILIFVYGVFLEEQETDCKAIIADFKVDRIVHNAPDLDEIARTNDTTPYNYRLSKYYTILVKTNRNMITDNNKVCALRCKPKLEYYFDVVALSKEDLKKPDGTYKKVNVDLEGVIKTCVPSK